VDEGSLAQAEELNNIFIAIRSCNHHIIMDI
jgi:hypothetical protein